MNSNFPYPKGSSWRKWDLQAQTILDDGYVSIGQYVGELKAENLDRWNEFVAKVGGEENALLFDSKDYFNNSASGKKERCTNYVRNFFAFLEVFQPDMKCIGITDHNYFDEFLLDAFIEYSKGTNLKIIPGIEINCSGIHLLLYFTSTLYGKSTFSEGLHAFQTKFDINNRTTPAGVLTTTSADIKKIITEARNNGGIVIFPHCNSSNGLFQERTKTDRTHLADVFNHQSMNLLQSQHQESSTSVAAYIRTNSALTAKFSTHISSDARSLRDYGRADKDGNYLWIKSDPTFEGLKQIIFEPEQRIFIGPQKPGSKKSYFIVDKVRFLDNTGDPKFGSDAIEINRNLTTIIGGKSTGKSLLLYYMAKTIDAEETNARANATGVPVNYTFDQDPEFNFEVTWEDGQKTLLRPSMATGAEASKQRKLLYIPQKYLNSLSEANIQSREAVNKFVLKVILQDEGIAQKLSEAELKRRVIVGSIQQEITHLFADNEDIQKILDDLKKAGDEQGIQTYIRKVQEEVDTITAKSGLTEGEISEHEKLTSDEKRISTNISKLEADGSSIRKLDGVLSLRVDELKSNASEYEAYINDAEIKAKLTSELQALNSFSPMIKRITDNVTRAINEKLQSQRADLTATKAALAPLVSKVKLQSELQQRTEAIRKEQKKLNDMTIMKNGLEIKRDAFSKRMGGIIESYKALFSNFGELRNELKKFESKFGEITLGVHVAFNSELFETNIVREYLNRTDLKRLVDEADWGSEFVYHYDPTKHLINIERVFGGLLNRKINTVRNRSIKDAVSKLLGNYFFIDFQIFYRGDSLDKMSPGKKGLVLLQLLVNLSDEEWPILLDQPEDDLDNRSVYEDLVSFLKLKKLKRQIIIVTHNPNLVVGSDAEEVVVANQAGQEIGRENKKFKFEYVSGALENSFELTSAAEPTVLLRKGIRQHVYEILEGGKEAFLKREQKYNFTQQ